MAKRRPVRALSSGDILDYEAAAATHRKNAADKPIHQVQESLLSNESGFTNFRGLINWGLILLLIFGGKMFLNNILTYGIILDPFIWRYMLRGEHAQPTGILFISLTNVFILIGFALEFLFQRVALPNLIVVCLVGLNLIGTILFPSVVILAHDWSPFFSAPVISLYIVIFLKLWSYAQVNAWCRAAAKRRNRATTQPTEGLAATELLKENPALLRHKQEDSAAGRNVRAFSTVQPPLNIEFAKAAAAAEDVASTDEDSDSDDTLMNPKKIYISMTSYPENLTLGDLYYFMAAPTLCYEINFPRALSIRKRFLIKRLLELGCLVQVIGMLVQQWMAPALKSSVTPFIESRWIHTMERLLNIAIPNHIIWLLGFYAVFHSFLNVLAEVLRFADRTFYKDWWHLYKPLLIHGNSRFFAAVVVFFVSAFFHELAVSVPLKMPRLWAFMGMLGQQPYALLVYHFCRKGGKLGNMAMWLTLIVGQPLALYMYFHDYYVQRYN